MNSWQKCDAFCFDNMKYYLGLGSSESAKSIQRLGDAKCELAWADVQADECICKCAAESL